MPDRSRVILRRHSEQTYALPSRAPALPASFPLNAASTMLSPMLLGRQGEARTMDAVRTIERAPIERPSPPARARLGMIIPSVNSMTEPQFNRFAPPGLAVHVARARVAGAWKRPLVDMAEEIATSARLLSDVAPDLIVFHCTDTSMTQGPHGEVRILDIEHEADGIFLSCTNTTQIEAIADIERTLGKPVVNSNQAVLWGCMRRLQSKLGRVAPLPELGRLMQQQL